MSDDAYHEGEFGNAADLGIDPVYADEVAPIVTATHVPGSEHGHDWRVVLPHQCGDWTVAVDDYPDLVLARIDAMVAALTEAREWVEATRSG